MTRHLFCALAAALLLVSTPPFPAAAQSAALAKPACQPITGLSALIRPGSVVLFGELPGTQQSPRFVADVLCAITEKKLPVTLGVELPAEEQPAIDRFLRSAGGPAAEAELTKSTFWHPAMTDGRSSLAMVQLLNQARVLRAAGGKVRVVALAGPAALRGQEHEQAMAKALTEAAKKEPKGMLVVLAGSLHTQLTRGTSYDAAFEPMGYQLIQAISRSRVTALTMAHEGGEAWSCRPSASHDDQVSCGPAAYPPQPGAPAWSITATADHTQANTGSYGVGALTASPPVQPSVAEKAAGK